MERCPLCGRPVSRADLAPGAWLRPEAAALVRRDHPEWRRADGACPACVQQALLQTLLERGEAALQAGIQAVWPLDAQAAFGALPTPLRMHADPRYTGRGVTIAFVDAGFYPHPDLTRPRNRIRAWVDAGMRAARVRRFDPRQAPRWPGWRAGEPWQWHGLMTSAVAAGNGRLSNGLYRGLASEADVVLIQVREADGAITNAGIARALRWLLREGPGLGVRVVNVSVGGDPVWPPRANPVDTAVAALVAAGVTVVAAAGNDGERSLVPPATAPEALTIGGLDDNNTFDRQALELWHSNYGATTAGARKPELVAPSIWVVAPLLPHSPLAKEARTLFERRAAGDDDEAVEEALAEHKLVTPHYQHVDGTSFAAPLVSSTVACMLEANPGLSPFLVRQTLIAAAQPVPEASEERQGAGALDSGQAVALALREQHGPLAGRPLSPLLLDTMVVFLLHDHDARRVEVLGEWDGWAAPGIRAVQIEPGLWQAEMPLPSPGRYAYKFLLDGEHWVDDPASPLKALDAYGGLNSVLEVARPSQSNQAGRQQ